MPRSLAALVQPRLLVAAIAAAVLLGALASCRDGGSAGPLPGRSVSLGLRPSYAVAAAPGDLPINRIRIVARDGETEVGRVEQTVDPTADEWPMTVDVVLPGGAPISVTLTIELINVGPSGEQVQWSGIAGPIEVSIGTEESVADVSLGRGPLENQGITGVALTLDGPTTLEEGQTATPVATVSGPVTNPIVFWTSLDPTVATVSGAGVVSTLRDGTARIVAAAGAHADTIALTVTQRPASIAFATDSARFSAVGSEATIGTTVLDPRGAAIAGATVTWTIADATIVEHRGDGTFRALRNGTTAITASVAGRPAVTRTTGARVTQVVSTVDVLPPSVTLPGVGATATLTADVRDPNGVPIENPTISWTSGDASVATVSATGVVTAVARGSAWIRGASAGVADSAEVTVAAGVPAAIEIVAGDAQAATVSTAVPVAPAVRVLDNAAAPVPGVTVTFAVTVGGGSLLGGATAITGLDGIATSGGWVLGTAAGLNTLSATVGDGLVATIQATGRAGAPTRLGFAAQPTGTTAGAAIVPAVVVEALDAFGNLANEPGTTVITLALAANPGGATLGGELARLLVAGRATFADLALDRAASGYSLQATSPGLTSATSTTFDVGAGAPFAVTLHAGDGQSATAGTAVAASPAVRVTDAQGNPVAGIAVTFAVASGGGAAAGATSPTDADGIAAVGAWTLGAKAGENTLTATVGGLPAVTFRATGTAGAAASMSVHVGDAQSATAGTAVPVAPAVRVLDAGGNPVAGVAVTFTATAGGGGVTGATATSDADGVAAVGAWTLGTTAGANALQAAALELAPVVFGATGTPGAAAALRFATGPSTVDAGATMAPAVVVELLDAHGNRATGASLSVALALEANPGEAALGGTLTRAAEAGIATFDDLSLDNIGTGYTLAATAAGLPPVTSGAFDVRAGPPALVEIVAGDAQTATAGTAVAVAPSVRVRDAGGNPAAGATITFLVTAGGGSAMGETAVTDAAGIAAVGSWTLGTAAGANTLQATAAGVATAVSFSATGVAGAPAVAVADAGDGQSARAGTTLPGQLVVLVTDAHGNPVADVPVTWTAAQGAISGASGATDAAGRARASWTLANDGAVAHAASATPGALAAVPFGATATYPAMTLSVQGTDRVSRGHTQAIVVTLAEPALAGGATVSVTSDAPGVIAVEAPASVTIAAGDTQGTVMVTGVADGTTTLRATATGYAAAAQDVTVELRALSTPPTLNVPFSQTASLPITLSRPAPPGGLEVAVVSGDPSAVVVQTPTVTIPAGALSGNATLFGQDPGPATISLTAPNFDPTTTNAATTAALNITVSTANFNASFGSSIVVRFESNGSPVPAPSPGITVNLAAVDPGCVAVQATATIPTGLVDVTVPLSYSGPTNPPCSSRVRATATDLQPDSVTANVAVRPSLTVSSHTIGAGLQRAASVTLGATNHGGTSVRLESTDPAALLISLSATTPGVASLDVPVAPGGNSISFVYQVVAGARGSATVTATAPGFNTGTGTATIVQPALDLSGLGTARRTLDPDDAFTVRVGTPNAAGTDLLELQAVRAGGTALRATVTSSSPAVGELVTTDSTRGSIEVTIPAGSNSSAGSVSTGGVAFRPLAAGSTTVSAAITGFLPTTSTTSGSSIGVTVTTPGITMSAPTVASGLQRAGSVTLGASDHGGVTVRVTSADSGRLLLAANATDVGSGSIDVLVPGGSTTFTFFQNAIEDTTGAVALTVTAPGFNAGGATANIVRGGVDISGLVTAINTLDPDDVFTVRVGTRQASGLDLQELQSRRPGVPALVATVTSSDGAVGTLVQSAGPSTTATVTIGNGQNSSPGSVGTGGVAFRPVGNGTATVAVTIPGFLATTSTTSGSAIAVTVTQPTTSVNPVTVGSGLMRSASFSLGASGHGGRPLTLTSADPTKLLLSPNTATPGSASITMPASGTGGSFIVHGVEGVTTATPVAVDISIEGFRPDTSNMTVVQAGLDISGLATTINTLDVDDQFNARIGIRNAGGTDLLELQSLRAGAAPVTVTVTSSNVAAATLERGGAGGVSGAASVTATIGAGQSSTPAFTSGGFALDPGGAGATTIAASIPGFAPTTSTTGGASIDVNVTFPTLSVSSPTVGGGLQRAASVTLGAAGHGGVRVRLTSSQPAVALIAPNATTVGSAFIDVDVPAGGTTINFVVQGVSPSSTGTVTIEATAPGFSDGGGTASVVQPGLDISGLNLSQTAAGADDPFNVRVGIVNGAGTDLLELQPVRFGAGPLTVTLVSGNDAVGLVKRGPTGAPTSGATVDVQIAENASSTPNISATAAGLAFDPVGGGSTRVTATAVNFRATTSTTGGSAQTVNVSP